MKAVIFVAFACLLFTPAGSAAAQPGDGGCSVSGTSTAVLMTDGPFAGLWQYTLVVSWDNGSPFALSHLTFDLDLDDCPCVCVDDFWIFDNPAGESAGEDADGNPCTVHYTAELLCTGDPSTPQEGPALKWEPIEEGCAPGPVGSGTFIFYSPHAPETGDPRELWTKYDGLQCEGLLTGDLPGCNGCPVPVEPTTWGRIKNHF